jgi:N-acetylglucosaminyl-diphospho-decaprenol L-rhamnosyltransferase
VSHLTIIVVSYNTRPELEACLGSLQAHPPSAVTCDILVVDNASSDDTVEVLRSRWPQVGLIEAGGNIGFARANNLGIRASAGDLVLLLNSDTLASGDAVDTMVSALLASPETGAVGPRIVDGDGRAELSFGRMMAPYAEWRQKCIVSLQARGVAAALRHVDRATRRRQDVDWVSGACLLCRRADAIAAGLLDERYFLYAEDVDFCAALRRLGRRIRFTPDAQIVHLRGASRRHRPEEAEHAYRRSHLAFYEKHHPQWAPLLRCYLRMRGMLPPRA